MNDYFDQFQAPQDNGCNCRICKRGRYERDLIGRLKPRLDAESIAELQKYLEWYFNALAHAETEVEALNYTANQHSLLRKYMRQVKQQEGTDFVRNSAYFPGNSAGLTEEEWQTLSRLSEESVADSPTAHPCTNNLTPGN